MKLVQKGWAVVDRDGLNVITTHPSRSGAMATWLEIKLRMRVEGSNVEHIEHLWSLMREAFAAQVVEVRIVPTEEAPG